MSYPTHSPHTPLMHTHPRVDRQAGGCVWCSAEWSLCRAYLANVKTMNGTVSKSKKSSSKKDHSNLPPVKYSHEKLEDKGIIISSTISEEIRKRVTFMIAPEQGSTSMFGVTATVKGISVMKISLDLEELLSCQANNQIEYVYCLPFLAWVW